MDCVQAASPAEFCLVLKLVLGPSLHLVGSGGWGAWRLRSVEAEGVAASGWTVGSSSAVELYQSWALGDLTSPSDFGFFNFQPGEVSKISTSLLLATVMSQLGYKINRIRDFLITAAIILVPMAVIIMESETGLALVYVGFIFMLYREGLSGWLIFLLAMAILTFVLTMSTSVFTTILVLLAITSFCIFLYSLHSAHRLEAVYFSALYSSENAVFESLICSFDGV